MADTTIEELYQKLQDVQYISPNEPISSYGVQRVLEQMSELTSDLKDIVDVDYIKSIHLWDSSLTYSKGDIVVFFKTSSTASVEMGQVEYVFMLSSTKDNNTSTPNYDLVNGIPNFSKSNWNLINPIAFLLQDINQLKKTILSEFKQILSDHVKEHHGIINGDISQNLLRKDFQNLRSSMNVGDYSIINNFGDNDSSTISKSTTGIKELYIKYGFDIQANQMVRIEDSRYYREKSPIWDESDNSIFSQKYTEDNLFPIVLSNKIAFNNLRYGTNIFFKQIEFDEPFIDDEYMVFFDTYDYGQFVFGYDKDDIQAKEEPTYDIVVSRPMLMNKKSSGFTVVLPIHTYFNSMQKYNIGVPWKNEFRLNVIGRTR